MSWLMTLLAHSCLPGCTSSFLAPSPLPLPYSHPPPLPMPPHRQLVVPLPPVPLLWLVVASTCCLRCGINVCSCGIVVCIVVCIIVWVAALSSALLSVICIVIRGWHPGVVVRRQRCGIAVCVVVRHLHCGSIICGCVDIVICIAAALSALSYASFWVAALLSALLSIICVIVRRWRRAVVIHCWCCGIVVCVVCVVICCLHCGGVVCGCIIVVVCIAAALSALSYALPSATSLSALLSSALSLSALLGWWGESVSSCVLCGGEDGVIAP
jgi:hypothetical protein